MPGMNGVALATAAKDMHPRLKIILASGYMGAALRDDIGDSLSAFDVIAKPYRLSDLVKRLGAE